MNGVSPDTYSVTFKATGYEPFTLSGVTVVQGQAATVTSALNKTLTTIGRTQARSQSAAFQPSQTTDQYNVGTTQITTALGKSGSTNESNLLASIPGASFDSSGYPVLRGGREYEEGFQFEGIDYTDAFTHQFINSLTLNGASNFQVQPGAGDASIGNAGTGAINIVAKRGTNPHFGQLEGDIFAGQYGHELRGEYGYASPNGRYSDYASVVGERDRFLYANGTDAQSVNRFFSGTKSQFSQDVVNNAYYKFGQDNNQSLQFFYENTSLYTHQGIGFLENAVPYKDNDQYFLLNLNAFTGGLPVNQIQATMPFTLGQRSLTDTVGGAGRTGFNYNQPAETFKFQYSNNLNSTTFLTAKFYRTNAVALFDIPFNTNGALEFADQVSLQGGQRAGIALDGTKQLGSKNILGFGGKYEFLRPVYSQPSASASLFAFAGAGGAAGFEVADFLPNDANCPVATCGYIIGNNPTGTNYATPRSLGNCYAAIPKGNGNPFGTTAPCPVAAQLPYSDESTNTNRQDWAIYVKDTFSPTDRLKIDLGLRLDGVNWKRPACDINACLPTSTGFFADGTPDPSKDVFKYDQATLTPRVFQPRLAVSFQATKNDAFRASYGRSVQFAAISQTDVVGSRAAYQMYNNVPSYNNLARDANGNPLAPGAPGSGAVYCGTTFDRPCKSYADQLYWENQSGNLGTPIQPLLPETFNNYDFSYSHLFPHQVSVKLTPFYNKAFNTVAQASLPIFKNGVQQLDAFGAPALGPPISTNLGKSQTTGVEFLLTKEAAFGLSGSLSLTYQNEFSNVIPTEGNEDFFPSIPPASLALGNLYRVGFLSPFVGALSLSEKTHSGWRINPVIYYNHGYPIGSGTLTAATVNGFPYNVPNTNLTNSAQLGGSVAAPAYVDPRNPGALRNPNIAATRGTPETSSAGGVLSGARFTPVQLTIEYSKPGSRSTFGALIDNVFNQIYQQPTLNTRYVPVATGIAGPYSGYSSYANYPNTVAGSPGVYQFGSYNFTQVRGNQPYLLFPRSIGRTVQFYYQINL